jgi:hypothetical protein
VCLLVDTASHLDLANLTWLQSSQSCWFAGDQVLSKQCHPMQLLLAAILLGLLACVRATYSACDKPFPFRRTPTSFMNTSTALTTGQPPRQLGQQAAAPSLFVGILTSSHGAAQREAVRATWLSQLKVAFPDLTYR